MLCASFIDIHFSFVLVTESVCSFCYYFFVHPKSYQIDRQWLKLELVLSWGRLGDELSRVFGWFNGNDNDECTWIAIVSLSSSSNRISYSNWMTSTTATNTHRTIRVRRRQQAGWDRANWRLYRRGRLKFKSLLSWPYRT